MIYDIAINRLDGTPTTLGEFRDHVLVIVNTASKCGFTPQYAGLEELYRESKDKKVVILGFPCNQFGAQEPGTAAEIAQFCETKFSVTFPMFEKIEVNGEGTHELYKHLKAETDGNDIKWNFEKFLVDQNGDVVGRYPSNTTPQQLAQSIADVL